MRYSHNQNGQRRDDFHEPITARVGHCARCQSWKDITDPSELVLQCDPFARALRTLRICQSRRTPIIRCSTELFEQHEVAADSVVDDVKHPVPIGCDRESRGRVCPDARYGVSRAAGEFVELQRARGDDIY
jgi:hypothetical protein